MAHIDEAVVAPLLARHPDGAGLVDRKSSAGPEIEAEQGVGTGKPVYGRAARTGQRQYPLPDDLGASAAREAIQAAGRQLAGGKPRLSAERERRGGRRRLIERHLQHGGRIEGIDLVERLIRLVHAPGAAGTQAAEQGPRRNPPTNNDRRIHAAFPIPDLGFRSCPRLMRRITGHQRNLAASAIE
jgi:hypothetical protein